MMHNFKFGSYLPDYSSTSIAGDKLILSPDIKEKALKQQSASDIKKRMSNTQNSWTKMNALKSFDSQITKSKGKLDIRDNSGLNELNPSNRFASQPKRLIPVSKSPIVFEEKIDPHNPSSLNNSFKNKPKLFWEINRTSFGKTHSGKVTAQSPLAKKHNINEGFIKLGETQKSKISESTTTESFKPGQVPVNDREKDKEVYDFMKKKNVHLGSFSNDSHSEAKSRFPIYNKNVIEELNSESKVNSNFIKSFYISGSPAHERPLESKLNLYGENIEDKSGNTNDQIEKNKQLKKDLLSHAFNLGYDKDTHKRVTNVDKNKNSVKLFVY